MVISRGSIIVLLLWLLIVGLATTNLTLFKTKKYNHEKYKLKEAALLTEQAQERAILESARAKIQHNHVVVATVTADDQQKIDFLNSGENVASALKDKANCDAYKRSWREFTNSETCAFRLTSARGDLRLLVLEYIDPKVNTDDPMVKHFLDVLNNSSPKVDYYGRQQTSIRYLKTYFEHEAQKFGVPFSLTVDVAQAGKLSKSIELPSETSPFSPGSGYSLSSFFLDEFRKTKYDVRQYDAVVIAILDTNYYDFRSFALPQIRSNITYVSINPYDLETGIATIAHETTHDFGAGDEYYETGGCVPGTNDEFIQDRHKSLMCHANSIDLDTPYGDLINKRTAESIGWLKK